MAATVVGAHRRCEACGFDPANLAPTDAAAAARSLARRWQALLDDVAEREDDGDALLHQRLGADGWSPVERAGHVADVFQRKAQRLLRVWELEGPTLDEVGIDAGRASAATTTPHDLVAQLDAAAERLAQAIERYRGDEWGRTGRRAGHRVTAWQLAAEAIHDAGHHLRACRDDLSAVCARPLDSDEEEQ